MAKLVINVRTYFEDGTHRNNRVEMQLPDEIAASIKNYWSENGGAYKCCEAWYLANNQSADCLLYEDNSEKAAYRFSILTRHGYNLDEDDEYLVETTSH